MRAVRENVITGGLRPSGVHAQRRQRFVFWPARKALQNLGKARREWCRQQDREGAVCRHHEARRHSCSRVGEGVRVAPAIQSGLRFGLQVPDGEPGSMGLTWGFEGGSIVRGWQDGRSRLAHATEPGSLVDHSSNSPPGTFWPDIRFGGSCWWAGTTLNRVDLIRQDGARAGPPIVGGYRNSREYKALTRPVGPPGAFGRCVTLTGSEGMNANDDV